LDGILLGGVNNITIEFDARSIWPMAYIDILGPNGDRYQESIDQGYVEVFSDLDGSELGKIEVDSEELYGWETDPSTHLSWAKMSFPVNLSIKEDVREGWSQTITLRD
jgi:hypothetical protein